MNFLRGVLGTIGVRLYGGKGEKASMTPYVEASQDSMSFGACRMKRIKRRTVEDRSEFLPQERILTINNYNSCTIYLASLIGDGVLDGPARISLRHIPKPPHFKILGPLACTSSYRIKAFDSSGTWSVFVLLCSVHNFPHV
jgi:hypothetical protein